MKSVLVFAATIYVTTLAALAVLLGVGAVTSTVGLPLVASVISAGVGAALTLINPVDFKTATTAVPAPAVAPVAATPVVAAPTPPAAPSAPVAAPAAPATV